MGALMPRVICTTERDATVASTVCQQAVADSVVLDANSTGTFKGKEKLPGGIYFIVSPKKEILFELLIDKEQQFSIAADSATIPEVIFTGSAGNTSFLAYSRFMAGHPISEEQLSHTLAKSIHSRIPRDEKILERVQLSAQDLWQVAPNSPLAKSVEELARRIEVGVEVEATADPTNSLVSRLLNVIGARA